MMAANQASEPNYLRFTALKDSSSVTLNNIGTPPDVNLEYRLNGGNWTAYTYGTTISLDTDDYFEMRNSDDTVVTRLASSTSNYRNFAFLGKIAMSGDPFSLTDKTVANHDLGGYGFLSLFAALTSANQNALVQIPTMRFGNGAYYSLRGTFSNCRGLTEANFILDIIPNTTSVWAATFASCSGMLRYHFNTIHKGFGRTFNGNSSCEEFIIDDPNPPTISSDSITGLKSDCIIYVPDASVDAYKAKQYWDARANYIKGISERPSN